MIIYFYGLIFNEFGIKSYDLYRILLDEYKVFITPGADFWETEVEEDPYSIRICFAAVSVDVLQIGLKRLQKFIDKQR